MYKIEYDIKPNATGRPCIDLPDDYDQKPEDRFFAIELTRYILQDVYSRQTPKLQQETSDMIHTSLNLLGQLGDEIAELLRDGMKTSGDAAFILNNRYHLQVQNIIQLNRLGNEIFYEDKVFRKKDGLKVLVTDEMKIYVFDDNNWTEVK